MKVIIIGGGAAGASCAARLRRLNEKASITILEQTDEISIANCGLPYYISDIIPNRDNIQVSDIATFKTWFNVDIQLNTQVKEIRRETKEVITVDGKVYPYDKLVLAVGASPFLPDTKGFDNDFVFTVRHLSDADKIKSYIQTHTVQNAIVIGGGFIGLEMAENLKHMGISVSVIEAGNQILNPFDTDIADVAHHRLIQNGISVYLNTTVQEATDKYILLSSGEKIPADMIIVAIGVRPETEIAIQAGLKTGLRGAIQVNESMQTSDPDIYAAGDSVEVKSLVGGYPTLIPLAGPANRQGRIIADNICGISSTYQSTQGSSIIQLFDTSFAMTGATEKSLQSQKMSYQKIHVWANSHAGYYPNAYPMLIKLLFDDSGNVLGAQAYGHDGIDKTIDVLATLIRQKATITDLVESELCYAPPFSSAKSPVNIVGMAAENILRGLFKPCFELDKDALLVDVRPAVMFAQGSLPNAINIPITEIRNRLNDIPKDRKVIVYCAKGYTGYVAASLLRQEGFSNIVNLSGGLLFFKDKNGFKPS